jgi:hypothetical protein
MKHTFGAEEQIYGSVEVLKYAEVVWPVVAEPKTANARR